MFAEKIREYQREEGRSIGRIEGLITTFKTLGIPREQTQEKLMEQYKLSGEEAATAMKEYWDIVN